MFIFQEEDIQNESNDVHQTKQTPREKNVHIERNSRADAQLREPEPVNGEDVNEVVSEKLFYNFGPLIENNLGSILFFRKDSSKRKLLR